MHFAKTLKAIHQVGFEQIVQKQQKKMKTEKSQKTKRETYFEDRIEKDRSKRTSNQQYQLHNPASYPAWPLAESG